MGFRIGECFLGVCLTALAGSAACLHNSARADDVTSSSDAARLAYASAAALQNREAWDLAAEEWEALIKAHPKDPLVQKGRYYLGICQLKNDQWPAASQTFRDLIANSDLGKSDNAKSGDPATIALARWELGRGEFQFAQAKPSPEAYAAAAKSLGDYVEKSPGHPQAADAIFFLGESLWQSGTRDRAIEVWQKFIREHAGSPRMPEVLYALGVAQAEKGNRQEAAATLKRFADSFPTHKLADDVALWRADVAIALGSPAEAEKVLAALAAGKSPRAAEALERLGTARWNLKNWAGSAAAFEQLAKQFPTSPQAGRALLSAGMAFVEAKKLDEARPWLEKSIAAAGPQATEAAHRLALLEMDTRHPARAAEVAAKAIEMLGSKKADSPGARALLPKLELDRADALWEIPEQRAAATAAYASILEKYPADPVAKTSLSMTALALLEQGKPDESLAKAELFLKKYPATAAGDQMVTDVGAIRAEALLAKGNHAAAATAYRELIAGNAKASQINAWKLQEGVALVADKQWSRAHESLAAAASGLQGDAAAEAMLLDATALVELKKPADAAQVLASLTATHAKWPRRNEAMLLSVRAHKEMGDVVGARKEAEELVTQYPDGTFVEVAWYRLGQLRQEAGDVDKAIEAFAKSRTLKPKGNRAPWGLLATGWCHEAKGRLADASKAWTELLDAYPDSPAIGAALLARSDARQRMGDYKGGLADAQRLLAGHRDGLTKLETAALGEAGLLAGLCLTGEKKYVDAAVAYQQLLKDQPDFPAADRARYELGMAQSLSGKPTDAEATFRTLVEGSPKSSHAAEAWLEIAESQWTLGRFDEAAKAYRSSIAAAALNGAKASPLLEQARHKLAWTHVMKKNHTEAASAFAEQLAQYPAGPLAADAQAMLGESLFCLGKFPEASAAFASAIKAPEKLSSDELRGVTFVRASECASQQKKWTESLSMADQLIAVAPKSAYAPQARYAAAWARQNLGQLDQALNGYRELADAARSELAARARLMEGEVLFEQGKHKDAIKAFFKAAYGFGEKQAPPSYHAWQAQATFEAARCFEVLAKPDQARKLYAELVDRYPDSPQTSAARKRLEALGPAAAADPNKKAS